MVTVIVADPFAVDVACINASPLLFVIDGALMTVETPDAEAEILAPEIGSPTSPKIQVK